MKFNLPQPTGGKFRAPITNKKTSQVLRRVRGRLMVCPNRRSQSSEHAVRQAAIAAGATLEPSQDIRLVIEWHIPHGGLDVTVEPMGPPPTRVPSGRGCDIIGLAETIQDALQGIAFRNDAQVGELVVRRVYHDPIKEKRR